MRAAEPADATITVPARPGKVFGLPIEGFGLFATLLLSTALGFAAFFLTTFVAIFSLLAWNSAGHTVDMAYAYRRAGLPVGLVVWALALTLLGSVWVRRKMRGGFSA